MVGSSLYKCKMRREAAPGSENLWVEVDAREQFLFHPPLLNLDHHLRTFFLFGLSTASTRQVHLGDTTDTLKRDDQEALGDVKSCRVLSQSQGDSGSDRQEDGAHQDQAVPRLGRHSAVR